MSLRLRPGLVALTALAVLALTAPSAHAQQSLYVSNNNSTITKITNGVETTFASTGLSNPTGLAFDPLGNLYAANGNNTITKFTPGGVSSVFASTGLNGPYGLAFDQSGNLYAANYGNGTIESFTPAGVGSVFASVLSGPTGPAFLAFSPAAPNGGAPVPEASTTVSLGLMLALGAGTLVVTARKRRRTAA